MAEVHCYTSWRSSLPWTYGWRDDNRHERHVVEVVIAPGLLRERRQPTRADQLYWTRIRQIHREMHPARGSGTIQIQAMDIDGASSWSHEPAAVRPELGLR
jgi:hypothetical protein